MTGVWVFNACLSAALMLVLLEDAERLSKALQMHGVREKQADRIVRAAFWLFVAIALISCFGAWPWE